MEIALLRIGSVLIESVGEMPDTETVSNHIIWRGESFEGLAESQMTKKNAIQEVWSSITPLWFASLLKTPQTMKHFILISIMALMCLGCNGQPTALTDIPDMEYGDCEPEIVPVGLIFENVLDFIYDPNEDLFLIEYSDEVISQANDDEWNTLDYIQIECSKKDFFDVLEEYSVWTENHNQRDLNWGFIEIVSPVKGGLNYRYSLVNLNLVDF